MKARENSICSCTLSEEIIYLVKPVLQSDQQQLQQAKQSKSVPALLFKNQYTVQTSSLLIMGTDEGYRISLYNSIFCMI